MPSASVRMSPRSVDATRTVASPDGSSDASGDSAGDADGVVAASVAGGDSVGSVVVVASGSLLQAAMRRTSGTKRASRERADMLRLQDACGVLRDRSPRVTGPRLIVAITVRADHAGRTEPEGDRMTVTDTALRGVPLFSGMTDRAVDAISELVSHHAFETGEDLVRQGEPGDSFLII